MQLYAVGVYDFGLSEEVFWSLTFAQFHALSKQRDQEQKITDYGFGTVAAMVSEPSRDPKKRAKPFTWLDFYPHWSGKTIATAASSKTPEQMKNFFLTKVKSTQNARNRRNRRDN